MSHDVTMPLAIDDIAIPTGRRDVVASQVKRLADSIERVGLRHPVTVRRKGDGYALVAGRHRIEAFKKLGLEHIPACIVTMTNAEARMWEIAENLHRAELSKLERAEQIEEWRELSETRGQNAPSAHPAEHGVKKTAEALGVDPQDVRRAEKIAGIEPEAKEAAVEAGIDDNQSKLLEVAKQPPEKQVAKVIELADRPINHLETQEQWIAAGMRWWNKGSKEWREEFLSRIDHLVMDRQFGGSQ